MDRKTFLSVAFFTAAFSLLGFGLLQAHLVPYGFTLFCVMPFLIGYTIGQYPKFSIILALSGVVGLVTFLYMLVIGGLETIFCVLTLLPLILLLMFVGIHLGYQIRRWKKLDDDREERQKLKVYILPLIALLISGILEHFFTDKYTEVRVVTKVMLPYPKGMVFDYTKSFDTLMSKKPFLFSIGIQTPLKCLLEKDSVGARRTCYFREGTIDEVLTDFRRGEELKMKITGYNMPGRTWLHFEDAVYLFRQAGDSTELTRITSWKSELKPRFYWDLWEKAAAEAEHEYVLSDLRRRLDEAAKTTGAGNDLR